MNGCNPGVCSFGVSGPFVDYSRCTLKALALTPLVLSWLKLALKVVSFAGSMGSLTSLFSDRDNSSSNESLEKAPSSISEIRFPDRSILFRVTADREASSLSDKCWTYTTSKPTVVSLLCYFIMVWVLMDTVCDSRLRLSVLRSQNTQLGCAAFELDSALSL